MVPRCVECVLRRGEVPRRLLELEAKEVGTLANGDSPTISLQNVIPDSTVYSGKFEKNISCFFVETSEFISSGWPRYLNLMDEVWVPCQHNREAAIRSGVTVPIQVVPIPFDTRKIERSYKPFLLPKESDSFTFYTIGEGTPRKNFRALIQAFHLEFDPREPVDLVIQSSIRDLSAQESLAAIQSDILRIKQDLDIYRDLSYYKSEILLTEYLTEEEIYRLHSSCDCYVQTSYGEGWGLPIFTAMALGKTPISTDYGAVRDYLTNDSGWLVPGHMVPVTSMHHQNYTGRQEWCEIDMRGLRRAMREAYENKALRSRKGRVGTERAYDFSYEKVGKHMKEILAR